MKKIQNLLIVFILCPLFTVSVLAADGPSRSARKYLKKGQNAFENAEYEKARADLAKAIDEYPQYAEAFFTLGRIDLQEKKVQQAVVNFNKAITIDPGLADAQLALGRIYMAARQPGQALPRAESVLKNDPGNMEALLIKASAFLAQKKNDDVIRLLDPMFSKGAHDPNLSLLLSGAYFRRGDSAKGQRVLQEGIAANPEATVLHVQLADACLRSGDLKGAQQSMESVIDLDPDNIGHVLALARLYRQTEDNEKADQLLARSVQQDPANASKRIAVANYYLETGDAGHARELLTEGIANGDPGAQLRLALGELYIRTGNAQEAVDLLNKGLASTTADAPREQNSLRNALAKIYLAAGDARTAQSYADAVLDSDPQNLQALLGRGRALKAAGQPGQAVADFERLLQLRPDTIDGYLQLADAYLRDSQLQKAKSVLDTGLRVAPRDKNLLTAAYRVSLRGKDYKHAEEYLRTVVEEYPHATDAQAELGDFYLTLNDESSARREYSEIVLKAPRSPIGHIKLARLYTRQAKIDSAIEQLRKGYDLSAHNQAIAAELATTLAAANRHDEALALCDARLADTPNEALAFNLKGKVFTSMKKYKDAQRSFEKACRLKPDWSQASNDLAALFILQDKKTQAIDRLETALDKHPKNPVGCLTLGGLYEEQGEYAKAIAVYEEGVGQIPGFWSGANRLAFLLADRATTVEELDRAHQIASAAFRMKPGQGTIIDTLAWIQYKKGETKQALALYKKLIAAAPEDPAINYHMGVVLNKAGDTQLAKEKLQTATRDAKPFYGREHAEAMLKELESKS